jgi:hypothetical protein
VVQIWPGRFVCKQVTVCPGHIWTTLYVLHTASVLKVWKLGARVINWDQTGICTAFFGIWLIHLHQCFFIVDNVAVRWRNGLPMWRIAADMLCKESRTTYKGWSSNLGVGLGANNPSPQKLKRVTKFCKNFVLCPPHLISFGWSIKDDWDGHGK